MAAGATICRWIWPQKWAQRSCSASMWTASALYAPTPPDCRRASCAAIGIWARRWTLTPPAPGATSRWATSTRCGCLAAAAARPTPCCPTMRNFWLALPSNTKNCWPRSAPAHRKLTLWRKTRGCAQTTRRPTHRTRVRPPAAHWPRWSWPPSTSACPRTCPTRRSCWPRPSWAALTRTRQTASPPCWTAGTTPS